MNLNELTAEINYLPKKSQCDKWEGYNPEPPF